VGLTQIDGSAKDLSGGRLDWFAECNAAHFITHAFDAELK
jgi:hypothetical protein